MPTGKKQDELNIGSPAQKLKLNTSGNALHSFIHCKLLSDSSRNLIAQLGTYKFSTSIDPENIDDNLNNPDVFIYYDYPGLQLKYVFKGAGILARDSLQSNLVTYQKHIYLEEIIIEPANYKGALPYSLTSSSTPADVEKRFGKYNTFFGTPSSNTRMSFKYPEHGVYMLFDCFGDSYDHGSIVSLSLKDSIEEMRSYPTIYPEVK